MSQKGKTKIKLVGRYTSLRSESIVSIYLVSTSSNGPLLVEVKKGPDGVVEAEIINDDSDQNGFCIAEVTLVDRLVRENKKHGTTHMSSKPAKVEIVTRATVMHLAQHRLGAQPFGYDDRGDCDCSSGD